MTPNPRVRFSEPHPRSDCVSRRIVLARPSSRPRLAPGHGRRSCVSSQAYENTTSSAALGAKQSWPRPPVAALVAAHPKTTCVELPERPSRDQPAERRSGFASRCASGVDCRGSVHEAFSSLTDRQLRGVILRPSGISRRVAEYTFIMTGSTRGLFFPKPKRVAQDYIRVAVHAAVGRSTARVRAGPSPRSPPINARAIREARGRHGDRAVKAPAPAWKENSYDVDLVLSSSHAAA